MLLRQVQARPLQGHHLRALRRRGDAPEGAPRAHGSHRPGRARLAHLVLQGRAEPHRLPARHRPARAREGPLLRRVDRHERRQRGAREGPERPRGQGQGRVRADLRRPRRAARRPREAPRPPARVLRREQGEGLRRGRRLLDARPRHVGRGAGAPAARGRAQARRRPLPRARPADHDRGREEDPRARPQRRDPRRPQADPARARAGRRGRRADPRRDPAAREGARQGDRLEEGRDHEAHPPHRRLRSSSATSCTADDASSSRGVDHEEPREGARPRQRPAQGRRRHVGGRPGHPRARRTTSACAPTGRSRRRISTRSSSGR